MQPFTTLAATAAPMDESNIDTDQLAPARFLRTPREQGYGGFLFHDLRFAGPGEERPDFVLNRPAYRDAKIIVAEQNFGGGSSREQAVWALVDHGIRCVIAESFGDIFYENSVGQGLLLVRLDAATTAGLRAALHARPGASIAVDLEAQTVTAPDGTAIRFEIEAARKRRLLLGLDAVGLTLQHEAEIAGFEAAFRQRRPWLHRAAG